MRLSALLSALAVALAGLGLTATARAAEDSPVVLTVVGDIVKTNRGPFDAFTDSMIGLYAEPFEKAYSFTLADLRALPQQRLTAGYPSWKEATGKDSLTVKGPSLAAILKAADASSLATAEVLALDGYAAQIPVGKALESEIVMALEVEGKPIEIGGRGPLWMVWKPGVMAPLYEGNDDSGLVWAVFLIQVK